MTANDSNDGNLAAEPATMAKKKSTEKTTESREVDAGAKHNGDVEATAGDATLIEAATPAYLADEAAFLAAEVQTFLNKRGELAERLAREIEATQRRLEELRRSLALLSPAASNAAQPTKPEKKAKKPTLKKAEKKPARHDTAGEATDAKTNDSAGDAAEPANPQANNGAAA